MKFFTLCLWIVFAASGPCRAQVEDFYLCPHGKEISSCPICSPAVDQPAPSAPTPNCTPGVNFLDWWAGFFAPGAVTQAHFDHMRPETDSFTFRTTVLAAPLWLPIALGIDSLLYVGESIKNVISSLMTRGFWTKPCPEPDIFP